jgi:hypothetical protein
MSERRTSDLERDLESLRQVTERDRPTIHHTARLLAARRAGRATRPIEEGYWMKSRRFLSARPWLAAAAAAAIVAAVLGIVPISYERTTGQQVTLSLDGAALDRPALDRIAGDFERALGATNVNVIPGLEAAGLPPSLSAHVPARSRARVERAATTFANALAATGIPANVRIAPLSQRVSSNVYALAMDRAIQLRIERAGRTPAEIEADVRGQLEAAGVQNPQVHVSQEGGQTSIRIQAETQTAEGAERHLQVQLNAAGDSTLTPTINNFEVKHQPGMTDADIKADMERQLREAGMDGEVTVENGKVMVRVEKHKP